MLELDNILLHNDCEALVEDLGMAKPMDNGDSRINIPIVIFKHYVVRLWLVRVMGWFVGCI